MSSSSTPLQPTVKPSIRNSVVALLVGLSLGTVVLLTLGGDVLPVAETASVIVVSMMFFGVLALVAGYDRAQTRRAEWLVFVVWGFLLVSEEVFSYRSDITTVSGADFASAAYAQAALWFVALLGLTIIIAKRPQYLRGLFQGDYKWVTWITVVSILSCAYSPSPSFSLAWAFKLALIVLLIHVCAQQMSDMESMRAFLSATVWSFVFLVLSPTLRSIFLPDPAGEYGTGELEQRFREGATGISGVAGTLAMLCLMLYSPGKRKWPLWLAGLGLVIMVAAGGKAGIAAGLLSGILFFAMQKRFAALGGFLAVTTVILILALLFTPLSAYFSTYTHLDQAGSFTGRTDLWTFVLPFIEEKPILGHGFIASRFVGVIHPDTPFGSSHMHNSFLETLYNNGLIGLVLTLMINFVIVRNLVRTFRSSASPAFRYFAVGSLAVYANILVNGMFNAIFGGRPDAPYMMLIALVVISERLLSMSKASSQQQMAFAAAG